MTRTHLMTMKMSRFGSIPEMHLPKGEFKSYAGPSPREQAIESEIQVIRSGVDLVPSELARLIKLDSDLVVERGRAEEDQITSKEVYSTLSTTAAAAAASLKLMDDPNHPGHELDQDPREGFVELRIDLPGYEGKQATFFRYDPETGVPCILSEADSGGLNMTEIRWHSDGNLSEAHIKRNVPREDPLSFDFSRHKLGDCFILGKINYD